MASKKIQGGETKTKAVQISVCGGAAPLTQTRNNNVAYGRHVPGHILQTIIE